MKTSLIATVLLSGLATFADQNTTAPALGSNVTLALPAPPRFALS